ncbi:hypothetical protein KIN20_001652 [Parelaphostrongylus tenuis]|uniref:Uncharacterized protein n=1 Tax=Parelaphostrongylus tenuis TaxID=148309 RepID=A0AAD5LUE3_PARTN|nr:hypothetical protein KIN20_001652 [Parelaphostrongylus tenuis]
MDKKEVALITIAHSSSIDPATEKFEANVSCQKKGVRRPHRPNCCALLIHQEDKQMMKVYGSYLPSEMALRPLTNRILETTEKRVRFTECCRKLAEEENFANARQKLSESTQGAVCVETFSD